MKKARRSGFTLVEVLVTTIVVGVLAAVVIPSVTNQTTAADPTRVVNDLNSVGTAIEQFNVNVRPYFPGDLDDLVNTPNSVSSSLDADINGAEYPAANVARWLGPYLKTAVPDDSTASSTGNAFASGYASFVDKDLTLCHSESGQGCITTGATTQYVSVILNGLSLTEFTKVNTLIDGSDDSGVSTTGRLRYNASGTTYFLAVPYSS